jgi:hypothetical protein
MPSSESSQLSLPLQSAPLSQAPKPQRHTRTSPLDESTRPAKPNRLLGYSIHLLILFVGLGSGITLIYSLKPPPPAPGSLLYEVTLFSSDTPVEDFTPHFQMLQANAAQGVRITSGGGVSGNITFSAEPKGLTQFDLTQINQATPFTTLEQLECEVRGDPIQDRIRTRMKLVLNNTSASHHFELKGGEYRALEVIRGEKGVRQWCYAIVSVQRTKTPPPLILVPPRPAPVSTPTSP